MVLKSRKFRKIAGFWLKMLVWLVMLTGVVLVQSGAFRPVEVEASINVSATVNEPIIEKVLPATGPMAGNTSVTITGENFEDVNAVTFGGVNALSFKVESPTLISALTPPGHAGAVKVVVVTEDKAVSLNNGFTYVAPPTATTAPSPTATISPTNPVPTATAPTGAATPAVTTPTTAEITGSPETVSPGTSASPDPATTVAAVSPSPEATTPESSPSATVEPTGSPVVTPGTVTTGPVATPVTTAAPSVLASPSVTMPAATVTNPPPSQAVSPTAVVITNLTPTPTDPASSPTVAITTTPAPVSVSPSVTPTASSALTVTTTAATGTAGVSPTATTTVTSDNTATVIPITHVTEETPNATVVVAPTPTAIVAPTATPAVSPSPSPSPEVSNPPGINQVSPATGSISGGTVVIIIGANFTDDTQVTFGGLYPASVIINSPTQITVVTAAQPAGKISIVVKTGFGLAALVDGFTYTSQPVEISQQPASFNYSGKLTGKVLTLKSTFSVGVKDLSASGIGWHLVARSTVLSSGNDVIPVANHTIQNVRVTTKSGTPPQNAVTYPLIFPTSDNTIFSAAPNTGTGESIITFETQLIVPPDIPAGNYKLTLNVTVEPGA